MLFGPSRARLFAEIIGLRADVRSLMKQVNAMSASFDRLKADVAAQTTVEQSAVTLIQGIAAQLKAAATGTADVDLDTLSSQLEAATAPLAAAVTANTPAGGPAPTPGV